MSPAQPVIAMQGIVKRYYIGKPNELEILHGIDLRVEPGEFVAIVGESGSGTFWARWTGRQKAATGSTASTSRRPGIKNWQTSATNRSASSFRPSI